MLKNISANWIQLLVSIAVAYYLTPFTLHSLGRDSYGTWLLITSITGYLSLLVMGLPMASVRFVARHAHDEDPAALNRAVANCVGLSLLFGLVALIAGTAAFAFFSTYQIPSAALYDARLAFIVVVMNTAVGFVGQVPIAILAAYDNFVAQNKILVISLLLRLAFVVWLLRIHPTLLVLAISLSLSLAFELAASTAYIGRHYPRIRPRITDLDWATIRSIIAFSVYVLILGVGAQLSFQTDAIVVGKFIGIDSVPLFSTPNVLPMYLMQLIIGIAAVLMPAAARLQSRGDSTSIRPLLLKWSKICFSLTLMVAAFLLVAGPGFLGWWLGPDFIGPGGRVLRILMLGTIVFIPVRGVAVPILMGIGNPRLPAIGFALAGAANLLLSVLWARPYGLTGVAVATIIPNTIFAALLVRVVCRDLGVGLTDYLAYVVPRPLIGILPVMLALFLASKMVDLTTFTGLFITGLTAVAVFGVVSIWFVYRGDPLIDMGRFGVLRMERGRP